MDDNFANTNALKVHVEAPWFFIHRAQFLTQHCFRQPSGVCVQPHHLLITYCLL
jgi:hypothetical protein